MKTLTGTTAAAQRRLSKYRVVWLVEIDADEPDLGTSTQRYAHRKYTLSGNTYADQLSPDGLDLSWSRLRVGGGLAEVSGVNLRLRNEEKASQLVDTYFLENDELRVYLIFVTGSETSADRIELARTVIENYPFNPREWSFDAIDGSDKDFREIPASRIDLIDYPDASLDALGKVVPIACGTLNIGPYDGAGTYPLLAPCRNLDVFQRRYTSGLQNDVYGAPFQYYPQARRFGQVIGYTPTGGTFTVDSAVRTMQLAPVLAAGTNDVAGWKAVADGNTAVGVAIINGSNLDVLLGGCPKLGTLTAITGEIKATGGYNYTVKLGATTKASGSASGNQTVTLTAADHADDWDYERYSVEIDGTGAATILEIYLALTYDDQETGDKESLVLFQKVTGWEDLAAYYRDGGAVSSAGSGLTNPVHLLQALLRAQVGLNLPVAQINTTAFTAAAASRASWAFAFALDAPVDLSWLNEYAFQAGLHLYKDYQGQWKAVAQDKTRVPAHTFLADYHLAVKNPQAPAGQWDYDLQLSRTPMRDLINEVALRYRRHPGSGEYAAVAIASGHYRVSGTGSTSASSATLTDASATFVTDGVAVGDTVYVSGDQDYQVDSVDSETQLTISVPGGGAVSNNTSKTYYVGPNLDGRMLRSQLRYKTENALGKRQAGASDEGGYASDLIIDSTTAQALVDHLVEWRSQRRLAAEFATFLNAVDVELGDAAWFDHPWLPLTKRPVALTTLSGNVSAISTTWTLAAGEAGVFRADDYVLVDQEVVKISAIDYPTDVLTVARGQCNTSAAAHITGASLQRLNHVKWEVTGLKPDVAAAQFRVEIQEMPYSYQPIGRVVAAGYPDYASATVAQRAQAGWATKPSGRVIEEDEYSAISYVGPSVS